jgi:hypothetical protein
MTKAIAKTDLAALLEHADGSYVAWSDLVKAVGADLKAKQPRSTILERQKRWTAALEAGQKRGPLAEINAKLQGFMRAIRAQTIGTNPEPRKKTSTEADDLMSAFLDLRDITEFLTAYKDQVVRPAVFAHLDVEAAEAGEAHPEKTSGRVVTTLGMDFCRDALEDDVVVDEDGLREALGAELASEVFTEKVVVTTTLDTEALMRKAAADPRLMALIAEYLVSKPRTARFTTRASKPATEMR